MNKDINYLSQIFKMLSNPVRLCILINLINNEKVNVTNLTKCSSSSQSLVSQQLSKLKLSGIISCEKVGSEVYYSIKDKNMITILKKLDINNCQKNI